MTDITFDALEKFGIADGPILQHTAVDNSVDDLTSEELRSMVGEFLAHAAEDPEGLGEVLGSFLTHSGIELTETPSDEFVEELATYIAHWGVLGMKWGRRKSRDGKYTTNPSRMAGNHPGHGGIIEVSGTADASQKPKVGMQANTDKGRGTITKVETQKDGTHKVTVDVPDPIKVKTDAPVKMEGKQGSEKKSTQKVLDPKAPTDAELSAVINRLKLEQEYAKLTAGKPPVIIPEVKKIIGNALKTQAQSLATQYLGVAVAASLKKMGVPNAQDIAAAAKKAAEDQKNANK